MENILGKLRRYSMHTYLQGVLSHFTLAQLKVKKLLGAALPPPTTLAPVWTYVHSRRDLWGARRNYLWARAQSHYEGRKFLAQNFLNGRLFRYQVLKGRPFYN